MNDAEFQVDPNGCLHWCMSLLRRQDRRFVVSRTFPESVAKVLHFVDAVDGKQIPAWRLNKTQYCNCTPSAYAVRLTKQLLLQEFLRTKHPFVCVYEDDAVLNDDFSDVLENMLNNCPNDWDCLFLGGAHEEPPEGRGVIRRCKNTFNNHCVVYSRKGAAKVASLLSQEPFDSAWSDREIAASIRRGELAAYCPARFVAEQRATTSDNYGSSPVAPTLYPRDYCPFMSPDDAHILYAATQPGDTVVEWGSGGSTLLLADRVGSSGKVISVEHQLNWFDGVRLRLDRAGWSDRSRLIFAPTPQQCQNSETQNLHDQFPDYVESPVLKAGVQEQSVDVAVVDGRQRVQCALLAAEILKPGGYLLFNGFWSQVNFRKRLPCLLNHYDHAFELPDKSQPIRQGLAVFVRQ